MKLTLDKCGLVCVKWMSLSAGQNSD